MAESSGVTLALNASLDDGNTIAGLGETLRVPPGATATVTAAVRGAPDASIAIITDAGCARRARTHDSGEGTAQWTGSGARFARVEVRRRSRFPSMVALSNPVWLSEA